MISTLLAGLLLTFSPSTIEAPGIEESAPIEIKIEPKKVVVRIDNLLEQEVTLWQIDRTAVSSLATIASMSRQSFRLPAGTYFVANQDSSISVAVPAFWKQLPDRDMMEINIGRPPPADPDWAWIPAGPTIIGDTIGIGSEDERPVRIEYLAGYWMGKTEVTNQQYVEFLNDQTAFSEQWIDLESRKCLIGRSESDRFSTDSPGHPVVMVSLAGAQAYVDWLSSNTGRAYRLPTESEWEKAARGPGSTVYSYGNTYRLDRANQESGFLMPVCSFPPNGFGLYDMTGNVFEWMSNRANPNQMDETMNHALRGGSFVLDGMYLRNSFRMRQSPTAMTDDIGFRVLREATEEEQK